MTAVAVQLPVGFAGADADEWPRPRTFPRAEALERGVEALQGVGPAVKQRLERLGLRTVGDLVEYRPRDYQRPLAETPIAEVRIDEETAIAGTVRSATLRRARGRMTILKAIVEDDTGGITATWFNQPWLESKLTSGTPIRLRGVLKRGEFNVKSHDIGDGEATADYAAIYPAERGHHAKKLRELVGRRAAALGHRSAAGAVEGAEGCRLATDALWALHRPRSLDEAERGRRRLAFDELLLLQVGLAQRRRERETEVAPELPAPGELVTRYREVLPFELTEHQERAIAEIDADLARTVPMQRLLQGDVGSGKTVVALYALLRAVEAGRQGALMAPTETLAEQHFLTLDEPCRALGVSCALLTSASTKRQRDLAPQADIVVGTHALIQAGVRLDNLAVAVVDEQHRFGVEQRKALTEGRSPHVLHMTATPIPRTLALTVYGNLAVSEIAKPPANRKPIVTAWVTEDRSARRVLAAAQAPRRRAAGVRRLSVDRGVRDEPGARGGSRGGAVAPRGAARLPRRVAARADDGRRAARADGALQGVRAPRSRCDDGDRGWRGRSERDDHDRAGGRPVRSRAAASVARPRRTRRGTVVLPVDLSRARGPDGDGHVAARGPGSHDGRVRAGGGRP